MVGIYKWTSPSGKIYIGQAVDLDRRKKEFLTNPFNYVYTSYNSAIDKARRKYNDLSQWEYEIINVCNIEYLDELEKEYIKNYNSNDSRIGYNSTQGGDGSKGVKWGTNKQIESAKNKNVKGKNNPMYGKHHTQEVKDTISKKNKGRTMSQEQKELRSKLINQYTKDGVFLKQWSGATTVMKEMGINKSLIGKVCKGIKKSAGGYVWKYAS